MNLRNIESKVEAKQKRIKKEWEDNLIAAYSPYRTSMFAAEVNFEIYKDRFLRDRSVHWIPTDPDTKATWEYIHNNLSDICKRHLYSILSHDTLCEIKNEMHNKISQITNVETYKIDTDLEYKRIRITVKLWHDATSQTLGFNFN